MLIMQLWMDGCIKKMAHKRRRFHRRGLKIIQFFLDKMSHKMKILERYIRDLPLEQGHHTKFEDDETFCS